MLPGFTLDAVTPDARVATAVAPFVVAMVVAGRILGEAISPAGWLPSSTMWFAFNVLMAPYSAGMRQELVDLQQMFR